MMLVDEFNQAHILLSHYNDRRTIRPAKATKEEEKHSLGRATKGSSTFGGLCHSQPATGSLPMESERPSVSSTDRDPATILLPQGKSRLQLSQRRSLVDHGK